MSSEAAQIVEEALSLELARVLAMAAGSAERVAEVDEALDAAFARLEALGVAFPGHVLGARYDLSGPEYVLLQVALMGHHRPEDLADLLRLLGAEADAARLSHGMAVLGVPEQARAAVRSELEELPLLAEGLVKLRGDGADPWLVVHRAVLELYGLAD